MPKHMSFERNSVLRRSLLFVVDEDEPTSAILSPEEIAEELNQNKKEEEDEEKKQNEEEEERPVLSTTQALKLAETFRHFLSWRSESGSMLDKLSSITLFCPTIGCC